MCKLNRIATILTISFCNVVRGAAKQSSGTDAATGKLPVNKILNCVRAEDSICLLLCFRIRKDTHLDRKALLAALVCRTFKDHTMIFVPTKREAHEMHILLGLLGIKVRIWFGSCVCKSLSPK